MTCFESQSNIMAFIDKKLNDEQLTEFVRHVKHCPNCSEELEIYYTLIVGMREVDTGKELSLNFKKDLENELDKIDSRYKTVKRAKISTVSVIFIAAIIVFFIFYGRVLDKVYDIEQRMIKDRQGQYYFYQTFDQYIPVNERNLYHEATYVEKEPEKTFYQQIRSYISTHIDYSIEDNW